MARRPHRSGLHRAVDVAEQLSYSAREATAYMGHQTTGRWNNRLQGLYSGDRRRFGNRNVFGERDVLSYLVFDWISSVRVGRGNLQFSVENLLNRQYFVRESQLLWSGRNDSYSASRGTVLAIGYRFTY